MQDIGGCFRQNFVFLQTMRIAFAAFCSKMAGYAIGVVAVGLAGACGAGHKGGPQTRTDVPTVTEKLLFSGDSAYSYASRQVEAGPRVPGTEAHRATAEWLGAELKRHGAEVHVQHDMLTTFDGHRIPIYNIMGSFNTDIPGRLLLVAHWDCRPWADEDPDPSKHAVAVDGANDGASGAAVLLELARVLGEDNPGTGIDLLLVDAEDWGTDGDDQSWAMGTRYFIEHPVYEGWKTPDAGIVVDMVGDADATFCREYFSEQAAPELTAAIWRLAAELGYDGYFLSQPGSAVTDDHVELIKAGIPAIDIIDYRPGAEGGFCTQWHTSDDTMQHLSARTLESVGRTLELYLRRQNAE